MRGLTAVTVRHHRPARAPRPADPGPGTRAGHERPGQSGAYRHEALRAYWSEGVRLIPDLRFEVLAVYAGISTVVINYRNQVGGVVCEVLTFDGALVREGHGTYPAQAPVGLEE